MNNSRLMVMTLAGLAMFIVVAVTWAYEPTDMALEPWPLYPDGIDAGSIMDVEVQFDPNGTPVSGIQAFLDVDPSVLFIDSISPGLVFSEYNWRVLLNQFHAQLGEVGYAGGEDPLNGGLPASNGSVLAIVRFEAVDDVTATKVRFHQTVPRKTKAAAIVDGEVVETTGALPDRWLGAGVCGDINQDGTVDVLDAVLGLQIVAGDPSTAVQRGLGDVVRDGTLDVLDVEMIIQMVTQAAESWACGAVP